MALIAETTGELSKYLATFPADTLLWVDPPEIEGEPVVLVVLNGDRYETSAYVRDFMNAPLFDDGTT